MKIKQNLKLANEKLFDNHSRLNIFFQFYLTKLSQKNVLSSVLTVERKACYEYELQIDTTRLKQYADCLARNQYAARFRWYKITVSCFFIL